MTQKTTKPFAARIQPLACPSALPKRNGRGRTRFLTHCAGLRDTNSADRTLAEEYPAAAGARSPEDVAAMYLDIVTGTPPFSNAVRRRFRVAATIANREASAFCSFREH